MKILYVSSEAFPFCKTGGLADVAGSLPPALARNGDEVAVILPLYGQIGWAGRGRGGSPPCRWPPKAPPSRKRSGPR